MESFSSMALYSSSLPEIMESTAFEAKKTKAFKYERKSMKKRKYAISSVVVLLLVVMASVTITRSVSKKALKAELKKKEEALKADLEPALISELKMKEKALKSELKMKEEALTSELKMKDEEIASLKAALLIKEEKLEESNKYIELKDKLLAEAREESRQTSEKLRKELMERELIIQIAVDQKVKKQTRILEEALKAKEEEAEALRKSLRSIEANL